MISTTSQAADRDILARVYGYAEDVEAGRIVACKKVRMACRRFMRDLERQADKGWPWRFDEELACRPIRFMEQFLAPTKGDYDRMRLLPWQCFVQANLYGWVDKRTGLRRFREALIVVAKGNGKSTMVAGNSSYGASKDNERGADIYLLANTKEQAGVVFDECRSQILSSPILAKHFRPLRDAVFYDRTLSSIKHRASDSHKLDGLNPHMAIYDEIHEYRSFKLINVIRRGMNKRRQPLTIYITTKGEVLDGPLMYYLGLFTDAMVEGKLRNEVADRMFAFIAELDPEDAVEDAACWIKANPSLGVLLSLEQLKDDWARCQQIPQERSNFINKQLNRFTDTSEMAFVGPEVLARNTATIPMEALRGKPCYGGFDLSSREDFTAAALEFLLEDRRVAVIQHSWVPRRKVELDNEKIPYTEYAMQGLLTIVPGDYIDQEQVFDWFRAQAKIYEILSIGYDPANAVFLQRMMGMYGLPIREVRQGPLTLNDPMKDVKELLLDGRLVTPPYRVSDGRTIQDPLLHWYIGNVQLRKEDSDREKANWMPTKANRYRKIDGYMAWLDAHTEHMRLVPLPGVAAEPKVTVYQLKRG